MKYVLILIGVVLTLNGVLMSIVSNFNFGLILTLLSGIFFLLWGIFYKKIREVTRKGILRLIKYFLEAAIILTILAASLLAGYGCIDNTDYKEEAVIVLGAGVHGENPSVPLVKRLESAKRYYEKNPRAVIVVTGGRGFQEDISEAEAMERYLVKLGVPKENIIKEEKAHNTYENMKYSKEILDEKFGDKYSAVIITNSFHIFRGVGIAKNVGFLDVRHYHAETTWYNWVPCYLRECLAAAKFFVTGK